MYTLNIKNVTILRELQVPNFDKKSVGIIKRKSARNQTQ